MWDYVVGTSDPLRAKWSLDIEQFLHSQRVSLLIAHHGDIVQAVKVGEGLVHRRRGRKREAFAQKPKPQTTDGRLNLQVRLVLDEFLRAAVQQTNVGVALLHRLSAELHDQAQHAVGRRMLRAKVDGQVGNFLLGRGIFV